MIELSSKNAAISCISNGMQVGTAGSRDPGSIEFLVTRPTGNMSKVEQILSGASTSRVSCCQSSSMHASDEILIEVWDDTAGSFDMNYHQVDCETLDA